MCEWHMSAQTSRDTATTQGAPAGSFSPSRRKLLGFGLGAAALAVPGIGVGTAAAAPVQPTAPRKTALTNVRVFDGNRLSRRRTVVIDGSMIGTNPSGARIVDGAGAVLLPGLIDAHIHLANRGTLEQLRSYGVTTALDMATVAPGLVNSLRNLPGLTDIRSAGVPAIGPGDPRAGNPAFPADAVVGEPADAAPFVAARIAEGSDYIKIIVLAPGAGGPDQSTLAALVSTAHARGRRTVAHAADGSSYDMALQSGTDMITHVPLDRPLLESEVTRMVTGRQVAIPTLAMMEGTAASLGVPFDAAPRSVTALHRVGVRVLAGSDANDSPGVPFQPEHGDSLHHELQLLVNAGLSTGEALRAATSHSAAQFGLNDRGAIRPGLRADLVLIDGDPLSDIRSTRNILRVWCAGTEYIRG